MKSKLAELVTNVMAHAVMIDDHELTLEKLVRDEKVFERAIDFAGNFFSADSILGFNGDDLSALYKGQEVEYPSRRSVPWEPGKWRSRAKSEGDNRTECTSGTIPPRIRAKLLDRKATKQSQIQTISLIREHLWNGAGWHATAYLSDPDNSRPPLLVLAFEDQQRAEEIITGLHEELGPEDIENRLRIAIIRGIDRSNPFFYRVVLTSNLDRSGTAEIKYFAVLGRLCTMRATTDANLDRFLDAFRHFKGFFFTAGFAEGGELPNLQPFFEQSILKRQLVVKWARDIGLNDPDSMGISPDDDPVLLPDAADAPVTQLLQWKRNLKREK